MTSRGGRRTRAAGAALALALVASVLGAAPAQAAEADSVTLSAATGPVDPGQRVTLSGRVRLEGQAAARVKVRVVARDGRRWRSLTVVRADARGRYRVSVAPRASTRFRVETVRSRAVPLRTSPSRTVRVRRAATVTLAVRASADTSGAASAVTGVVRAGGRGVGPVRVVLERRVDGRWRSLAVLTTTTAGSFRHALAPAVTTDLRVRVPRTDALTAATSPTVRLHRRPGLVGVTPAGPSLAVAGVEKTVTGRLTPTDAGRDVRLQLRPADGAWSTVASARTVDGGGFVLTFVPASAGSFQTRVVVPAARGLSDRVGPVTGLTVQPSVAALLASAPACLGAAAMVDPTCRNPALDGLLLPTRENARLAEDVGTTPDACFNLFGWTALIDPPDAFVPEAFGVPCPSRGSKDPDAPKVALVGDSHAWGYKAGLSAAFEREGWRLDTFVGISCRWMSPGTTRWDGEVFPAQPPPPGAVRPVHGVDWDKDPRCAARADDVTQQILAGDYDLVVYTGLRNPRYADPQEAEREDAQRAARYAAQWRTVVSTGTPLLVLSDNGDHERSSIDCVVRNASAVRAQACTAPRAVAFGGRDPAARAARELQADGLPARVVDLERFFCREGESTCPLVVGHVLMHRDNHHLSGTYAATMAPFLVAEMRKEIAP